ncbi:hypothetical protein [Clostridium sp.]|nr:hypothetical protein [Clostridium sp.]MBS5937736.1 hypothetical protein [Clostridium sp.]
MAISDKNDRLTIIINKETKNKLAKIAEADGRSISNYVSRLIEKHVEEKR